MGAFKAFYDTSWPDDMNAVERYMGVPHKLFYDVDVFNALIPSILKVTNIVTLQMVLFCAAGFLLRVWSSLLIYSDSSLGAFSIYNTPPTTVWLYGLYPQMRYFHPDGIAYDYIRSFELLVHVYTMYQESQTAW